MELRLKNKVFNRKIVGSIFVRTLVRQKIEATTLSASLKLITKLIRTCNFKFCITKTYFNEETIIGSQQLQEPNSWRY